MTDTLDMLEIIGQDAGLRHATAADLLQALAPTDASVALKQAIAAGDSAPLAADFGQAVMHSSQHPTHNSQGLGHDEEEQEQNPPGREDERPEPEPEPGQPSPD